MGVFSILEGQARTWPAEGAISEGALLTLLSTGKVDVAGLADPVIGVARRAAAAADEAVPVRLLGSSGTEEMIASKAIDIGEEVFQAAAGKVSDAHGTGARRIGIAVSAAAADDDKIEVALIPGSEAGS